MAKVERLGPAFARAVLLSLLALTATAIPRANGAETAGGFPTQTVHILVGFAAGTSADVAARALAHGLSQGWNRGVVVDNVPGASGNIAGSRVARAKPDGHTLLLTASSGIVINPLLYRDMAFDPLKDLLPVSIAFSYPNILVVHKDVSASNVPELVALARAHPGALTCASAGTGTTQHLSCEMLKSMAGIDIVHLPYSGAANLLTDLLSGRVHILFGAPTFVLPYAREGRVKALAVSSAKRFAGAPELATLAESGFPAFDVTAWWGVMTPAGTPAEVREELSRSVASALASPELKQRFRDLGMDIVASSPDEFNRTIRTELPKWRRIVEEAGIRVE